MVAVTITIREAAMIAVAIGREAVITADRVVTTIAAVAIVTEATKRAEAAMTVAAFMEVAVEATPEEVEIAAVEAAVEREEDFLISHDSLV